MAARHGARARRGVGAMACWRGLASTPMAAAICGKSQTSSIVPSHSTTARKMVFSSWRTLPGQVKRSISSAASGVRPGHRLVLLRREAGDEMARQRRDVVGAVAQRRHDRWERR